MPQQKDDERKRRFTPKVKTGCFNCRRRRIKCPEQFPVCKRCEIAQLVCEYPYNNSNKRAAAQATPLRPRPLFAVEAPDGTALGDGDADLFGVFCSSIVHASSGVFNKRFWKVDVPRAATAYPAVWHAGIALAAIHLCVRKNDSYNYCIEPAGTSKPLYNSSAARNHQYLVALSHFHKAMLHLSKALNARRLSNSKFTYADQEMAILTNLLFIGITGMLEDPHQIQSHYKNLFRLLESVGFGNDNVNVQDGREDGITDHDELRTVVLDLEGTYPYAYDLSDDQAVKIPSYDSFTSLTQAYTEFMVLLHGRLACGRPNPPAKGQGAAGGPAVRLRQAAAFEGKLAAFEKDAEAAGSLDQDTVDAIEYMRQHMRVMTIRLRATRRTSREDAIQDEMGLESVMEYLEQQLTAPAASSSPSSSLSSPSSSPSSFPSSSARPSSSSMSPASSSQTTTSAEACPPPFVFSSSLGLLLEMVTFEVSSVSIRRRAIDLMRRFPYKEGGSRSEETVACTEAMILHELSGPERTRASQMAGMPIRPTYENGSLKDREFDGTRECECIRDLFVCREHMVASFRLNVESERPYNELASRYELRYGLPRTKYYF